MKKIIVFFILFFFINPYLILASSWYYPLEKTIQRQQYKKFNQYIDRNFYENSGNLYPAKYIGYHAGTDLEIFSTEEKDPVSVYAVSDGKIIFVDAVSGYGGLILLKTSNNLIFLYGHLDLSKIKLEIGKTVQAGQKIAYLGDAFSNQTGGERKHLHFALYKGRGKNFKGYENAPSDIKNNWLDSIKYLENQKALDLSLDFSQSVIIEKKKNTEKEVITENIFIFTFRKIINRLKQLF